MDSKLKGFIITFKTYLGGVGDFEFCQLVERSQIQESHRNMVKENPEFEDSDSDCDDVLRTWFLEQTLFYGDTLTDAEYDKYKTISCTNLQKLKDKLLTSGWLVMLDSLIAMKLRRDSGRTYVFTIFCYQLYSWGYSFKGDF